jgi:hypothetical protein
VIGRDPRRHGWKLDQINDDLVRKVAGGGGRDAPPLCSIMDSAVKTIYMDHRTKEEYRYARYGVDIFVLYRWQCLNIVSNI